MPRLQQSWLVLLVIVIAPLMAAAAEGELELVTERVVVFKDGYAMVVKHGSGVTDSAGELVTHEVPDSAVLGSFWAIPAEGRLLAMTAGTVTETEEQSEPLVCTDRWQILRANLGRRCAVETHDGARLEGVILRVLTQGARPERSSQPADPRPGEVTTEAVETAALFVLRTADGDVLLGVDQVRRMTLPELRLDCERRVERRTTRKQLVFRFERPGARQELTLLYFTPGLRWIPTYRVALNAGATGTTSATMALQAELLNELEDLAQVPVDLVVGVPSFRFREVPSPLSLESTLRNALLQAAPQLMGQQLSNALFSQRASEWRAPAAEAGAADGRVTPLPEELAGESSHDLYVYHLPPMSLGRGQRAAVPLLEASVPCRDVYTWDATMRRSGSDLPPGLAGVSPLELAANRVWHQVELDNTTGVPWTTGAALLVDSSRPLAQELLTYTPAGSRVRLPVTVAMGLHGSVVEEETGRSGDALRWAGNVYARVDTRVTLDLANRREQAVQVEVACDLGGRATSASDGGEVVVGPFRAEDWESSPGYGAVNPHSTARWLVTLAPGETVRRTLEVSHFVRS